MSNIGVINDSDCEFGYLSTAPIDADKLDDQLKPSEKIPPEKLSHLTPDQRRELLEILDRYPECFSNRPGFCDVVYHEINLKPDFTPKQSKAYRIPEILKPEVERQIDQLVKDGFLVPSKSGMWSPILCVITKKFVSFAIFDMLILLRFLMHSQCQTSMKLSIKSDIQI